MNTNRSFRISGLPLAEFQSLFTLTDEELASRGARRHIADAKPGFPCRVSLQDAEIGESVILLSYQHHNVKGPYNGCSPVYIRELATEARLEEGELPPVVRSRLMSVRAYDAQGSLLESDVVEGIHLKERISLFFSNNTVAYLHLHNAKPGCYSCRVDRA